MANRRACLAISSHGLSQDRRVFKPESWEGGSRSSPTQHSSSLPSFHQDTNPTKMSYQDNNAGSCFTEWAAKNFGIHPELCLMPDAEASILRTFYLPMDHWNEQSSLVVNQPVSDGEYHDHCQVVNWRLTRSPQIRLPLRRQFNPGLWPWSVEMALSPRPLPRK